MNKKDRIRIQKLKEEYERKTSLLNKLLRENIKLHTLLGKVRHERE